VLSRLKKQGHAGNEWADMATNGMQWVRNIQDGISTPEEALKGLESDLAHCRAVQAKADAPTMQVDASNLAALEGPSPHSEGVDERAAWVADMVAAGAKHLGASVGSGTWMISSSASGKSHADAGRSRSAPARKMALKGVPRAEERPGRGHHGARGRRERAAGRGATVTKASYACAVNPPSSSDGGPHHALGRELGERAL
jgi:hypothetical protein